MNTIILPIILPVLGLGVVEGSLVTFAFSAFGGQEPVVRLARKGEHYIGQVVEFDRTSKLARVELHGSPPQWLEAVVDITRGKSGRVHVENSSLFGVDPCLSLFSIETDTNRRVPHAILHDVPRSVSFDCDPTMKGTGGIEINGFFYEPQSDNAALSDGKTARFRYYLDFERSSIVKRAFVLKADALVVMGDAIRELLG